MKLSRILKRSAMIEASHTEKDDGSCLVSLSLSDGIGSLMKLDILAGSREQAEAMEKRFKASAEDLYVKIAGLLAE